MVSLQYGFGIAASQTFVAVTLTEFFELLDGKVSTTGVPRSPPFAKIVGLGLPDFFGIILCPLLATSKYDFTLAFVVAAFGSVYALPVVRCPDLLVLGNLFLCSSWYFRRASTRWGKFALAFSYWAYCSRCSRRYFCARALTHDLHLLKWPSVISVFL
jgi:hypothetical protein